MSPSQLHLTPAIVRQPAWETTSHCCHLPAAAAGLPTVWLFVMLLLFIQQLLVSNTQRVAGYGCRLLG